MLQKFLHIVLIAFAFCALLIFAAQAQEGIPADSDEKEIKELNNHPELNLNDDKTLLVEPEQKLVNHPTLKETTPNKTTTKAKPDKTHLEKEEEDALSFNFLYYIIQKFKISDIVDE